MYMQMFIAAESSSIHPDPGKPFGAVAISEVSAGTDLL